MPNAVAYANNDVALTACAVFRMWPVVLAVNFVGCLDSSRDVRERMRLRRNIRAPLMTWASRP
jgi:hypothetical protein